MNFFKSILSEDPDPPKPDHPNDSDPDSPLKQRRDDSNSNNSDDDGAPADGWSFGGLIKTLAVRSESVIETYRRDLMEFGDGLKKETEIIRETASRAVKDLPASIEAGASALDGVLKSTAEIISKESHLGFGSDGEPETPDTNRSMNSGRYSWFESQLGAIQSDLNTFCEEPEDVEEYRKWKLGFELEESKDEIDNLIGKNGALEGVYRRVVPNSVDDETFWFRYFYRVDKLKQQESVRAKLVKRAISNDDEEELSWDVDDDDEEASESKRSSSAKVDVGDGGGNLAATHNPVERQESSKSGSLDEKEGDGEGDKAATNQNPNPVSKQEVGDVNVDDGEKRTIIEPNEKSTKDVSLGEKEVKSEELAAVGKDEKVENEETMKEKNDEKVESGKSVDTSVVHQTKGEDEDLGWDEIEDIGSGDEKKNPATSQGSSPNRAELRKRLSAAEDDEDEDLNWDIEDDDEPVKA